MYLIKIDMKCYNSSFYDNENKKIENTSIINEINNREFFIDNDFDIYKKEKIFGYLIILTNILQEKETLKEKETIVAYAILTTNYIFAKQEHRSKNKIIYLSKIQSIKEKNGYGRIFLYNLINLFFYKNNKKYFYLSSLQNALDFYNKKLNLEIYLNEKNYDHIILKDKFYKSHGDLKTFLIAPENIFINKENKNDKNFLNF